jgi:glycosyltransferase involved in cell wall biosynthesis
MLDVWRTARWRVASGIGRFLVGGELARLERQLEAEAHRRAATERRVAELLGMIGHVRDRAEQAAGELAALRGDLDRLADAHATTTARLDARVEADAARLGAAVAELDDAQRAARDTIAWLERTAHGLQAQVGRHGRSIAWLARRHTSDALPAATDGPLVSIVLPTWNRAGVLPRAVGSVLAQRYARWELIVVDDGSTDGTASLLARWADEPRIRVVGTEHHGHASARNRGVAASRGEVVAYLDSDNVWDPGYLDAVARAFADPGVQTAYLAQLVSDLPARDAFVRGEPFDAAALRDGNYIDLNVFSHRRALVERCGGFDESLERLVDWDLILRYTAAAETAPVVVPAIGGEYALGLSDQVSARASYSHSLYWIWRKLERPVPRPVRAVFALWRYPQLSGSDVRAEVAYMQRVGVDVTIWREEPPAAAFESEVPVRDGALADVLAEVRPHVVHVHRLDQALRVREVVAVAGLPMTVRAHGSESRAEPMAALVADPTVRGVYLFPQHVPRGERDAKIREMASAFSPDRCRPQASKDPRLVVRVGAAVPAKEFDAFIRIAARCPEHRFVLAITRAVGFESYPESLRAVNEAHGNPVDLRVDLQHDEVAELLGDAGLYLHTHALTTPYGMPMSIAESMATGAYVVARACPEAIAYVGDAGAFWSSEDEAVERIRETAEWDDARWAAVRMTAVERAFARHADLRVLRPLLDQWIALAAERDG